MSTAGEYDLKTDPLFAKQPKAASAQHESSRSPAELDRLAKFRENKLIAGAELAPEMLVNRTPGQGAGHQVIYEKPWHRMALYLFSANMSIRDVANVLEMSNSAVSDLLHTEWFQKRLTALIEASGGSDVMALCKAEAINSIQTLIEIRDNPNVPAMARRACAMDLIERFHGKAIQKVETKHSYASSDPVQEAAALEKQIAGIVPQIAPPSFMHEKN